LKLRFPPAPPSRADRTLLPAALVAVLAFAAVLQLLVTDAVELPPAGPIGVGAPLPPVREPDVRGVPGVILSRPLFAPPASGGAASEGDEAAPADPLGGAAILGTIGIGRARYAMVRQAGAVRRVTIGGSIAGWRVLALGDEGAVLGRGAERLRRGYGAGAATGNGGASDDASAEDQQ
jgi:hypothetical protein